MTNRFHTRPALLAFALAALAAGMYFIFGADVFGAALGNAPGLLLAIAPIGLTADMTPKDMILQIGEGLDQFKSEIRSQVLRLQTDLDRVESKSNQQGLFGGGEDDPATKATTVERKAFERFLRTGDRAAALEAKAMSVGSGPDGGFAVPTWFDEQVYRVMARQTPLLGLVSAIKVGNFPARHIVSLGSAGSGWVGETAARPATNTPTINIVECTGADLYTNPQVTQWALDDIKFDAAAWLASEVGIEMAQRIQSKIVAGNGTNGPLGFLAAPQALTSDDAGRPFGTIQYRKTGQAAALPATTSDTIDLLIDTTHDLAPRYRDEAVWLMGTLTLSTLRKCKDADGRPILLDSMVTGQPATLLGYPVHEIGDMPDVAANALPIAFGNFKRGYVLDEHEAGLRVVVDQVTNKPYVGFYSLRRVDGKPLDTNAIKLIKCAA